MNPRTKKAVFHGFLVTLAAIEWLQAESNYRKHACAAWGGFHLSCMMEHLLGEPE